MEINYPKISICIPCYEMHGMGGLYLHENLERIKNQTYKNYEVVISDHSVNDSIFLVCEEFVKGGMDIKYFKNTVSIGNSSANLNNCISNSSGDVIKIIFQDDFLYSDRSLEEISLCFKENPEIKWVATSCCHTEDGINFEKFMDPLYTHDILTGNNRISSPSVISFVNSDDKIYFDPNYIWLMDCDYYYRLYLKYGEPYCLNSTNVVNRKWGGQLTKTIPKDVMDREHRTIIQKHYNRSTI
jgi:glycosyltransferase involved in cell wall biosynthesis